MREYELWSKSYPRDDTPHLNLGVIYQQLGQYDKSVAETKEALRILPTATAYGNLSFEYIALDQLDDAEKILREAQAKGFDGLYVRGNLYLLAFRRGDMKGMEQQLAWAAGRAGDEDAMLSGQADTHAYHGRLVQARDYSRRAVGVRSARRLEGDGGAMAGKRGIAGSRVREHGSCEGKRQCGAVTAVRR